MIQSRAPVERRVLGIVAALARELGGPAGAMAPGPDDLLDRDLGIGSLERVELLLRIDKAFGVRLPDAVMAEASTPRDLARAVLQCSPADIEAEPEPARLPGPGGPAPASAGTLVDVLAWQAGAHAERTHILLRREDGSEQPITYGDLWRGAQSAAAGFRRLGVEPGAAVSLMLRTEPAFFEAFFGALLAGLVPVPIYPPFRRDRIEEYARRQVGILANAQARALITFGEALPVGRLLRSLVPSIGAVTTMPDLAIAEEVPLPYTSSEGPALIQYTSGSTGEPKGVLLSHANLLANIRAIGEAISLQPDDVAVSWLPLYHDMGLIGCWLSALYFGVPLVLLSPLAFLARPARWLWALHAHRGTLSAAPNFAFDLCARKVTDEEIRGLDLSSWRLALNGSEAVSAETIERFTRRFAAYGLRPETVCPVYGLAEASVALAIPRLGVPPRIDHVARASFDRTRIAEPADPGDPGALRIVGCGLPLPGHEIRIVDERGRIVAERAEGRIEFRGPSVTRGYFRNPAATHDAFHDGWMDSGDLGYIARGDLFVTGRRKDLIIKAGRNLYPQELEEIVGGLTGIRRGCVAAFGVPDPAIGTERLIVIAESREKAAAERSRLEAAARDSIVAALGVPADTVLIGPPGMVLKTSSGKIRRAATREAYLRGEIERPRAPVHVQWLRLLRGTLRSRLRRAASRVAGWALACYLGGMILVTVPVLWVGVLVAPGPRAAGHVVRLWCRTILALSGCPIRVEGAEYLRGLGPAVLAANHASYLDVVVLLAALPGDFRFVAKRELLRWPLVGRVIRKVGHLTVERIRASQSVADADRVTESLRSGASVLVFPEGTFIRSPGILPFRLGAFKAALETGSPVIPVVLFGTRDVLPADRYLPQPGPLTVLIGAPFRPAGSGWPEMVRLRDETRNWIARRSGEPELERVPTAS